MSTPDLNTVIAARASIVRSWALQFANGFNQVQVGVPMRASDFCFNDGNATIRLKTVVDPDGGTPANFIMAAEIAIDGQVVVDRFVRDLPDAYAVLIMQGMIDFNTEIVTAVKTAKQAAYDADFSALETAADASYQLYSDIAGTAYPVEE